MEKQKRAVGLYLKQAGRLGTQLLLGLKQKPTAKEKS